MLGDVVIVVREICKSLSVYISKFVRRNLLCIHDYKRTTRQLGPQSITTLTCKKCGKKRIL